MIKITTIVNNTIHYNETVISPCFNTKNNEWVITIYEGHIDTIEPKNKALDVKFTSENSANIFYKDITTPCERQSGNINFQRIINN